LLNGNNGLLLMSLILTPNHTDLLSLTCHC